MECVVLSTLSHLSHSVATPVFLFCSFQSPHGWYDMLSPITSHLQSAEAVIDREWVNILQPAPFGIPCCSDWEWLRMYPWTRIRDLYLLWISLFGSTPSLVSNTSLSSCNSWLSQLVIFINRSQSAHRTTPELSVSIHFNNFCASCVLIRIRCSPEIHSLSAMKARCDVKQNVFIWRNRLE